MATLADVLPALVTALTGISVGGTPVVTLLDYIPQGALTEAELPAVLLEVQPPAARLATQSTRRIDWPIDIVVLNALKTGDTGADISGIYGLVDAVIARLDSNRTLNGLLHQTIKYAEPAVSADDDTAYGYTTMGDSTFIGTRVHSIVQDRSRRRFLMSKPDDVAYYYHGEGADVEYIPGAPARDVTVAEYEALAPEHKRAVQQTTVARGDKRVSSTRPARPSPKRLSLNHWNRMYRRTTRRLVRARKANPCQARFKMKQCCGRCRSGRKQPSAPPSHRPPSSVAC
jgi:hypothetical protein